jgi:ferredoxin-NADP reductase
MVDTVAKPGTARTISFETVVLDSVVETHDTRTLVLESAVPHHEWRAGQYVSIDPHQFPALRGYIGYLEHAKGRKEPPRAYSMCSAPSEPHLAITIKEEAYEHGTTLYPPLLSPLLVHGIRAGDRMTVQGFAGPYVLPDDVEDRTEHVLHLCAGSGSVPDFSIVKDSLERHTRLRHTFVYSNKTWDDVIFRDQLSALAAKHPGRLRVVHALTRHSGPLPAGADVRMGRVDAALLDSILREEPDGLIYACGPAISVWERRAAAAAGSVPAPRFIESMLVHLGALGVARDRITVESYG